MDEQSAASWMLDEELADLPSGIVHAAIVDDQPFGNGEILSCERRSVLGNVRVPLNAGTRTATDKRVFVEESLAGGGGRAISSAIGGDWEHGFVNIFGLSEARTFDRPIRAIRKPRK